MGEIMQQLPCLKGSALFDKWQDEKTPRLMAPHVKPDTNESIRMGQEILFEPAKGETVKDKDEIEFIFTVNKEEAPTKTNCMIWKQGQRLPMIDKELLGSDLTKADFKVVCI